MKIGKVAIRYMKMKIGIASFFSYQGAKWYDMPNEKFKEKHTFCMDYFQKPLPRS